MSNQSRADALALSRKTQARRERVLRRAVPSYLTLSWYRAQNLGDQAETALRNFRAAVAGERSRGAGYWQAEAYKLAVRAARAAFRAVPGLREDR